MLPGPAGPPRALWAPGAGLGLVDLAGPDPGPLILSLGSLSARRGERPLLRPDLGCGEDQSSLCAGGLLSLLNPVHEDHHSRSPGPSLCSDLLWLDQVLVYSDLSPEPLGTPSGIFGFDLSSCPGAATGPHPCGHRVDFPGLQFPHKFRKSLCLFFSFFL